MAHVVCVPKRDPCRKCKLPVFLAERLMVGKKVYHRTCLKCARCGFQLTPGSFYETEIDEQYCCETCPDEELPLDGEAVTADCSNVELRNAIESETNVRYSPSKSVRSSIKERLAFFENQQEDDESETKLLQKSLSDEEKSKSLQRIENSSESAEASYKSNVALSNFLINNIVDDAEDLSEPSISTQNSKMETSDSEDDTDDLGVSLPPELPKSLPPLEEFHLENKYEEKKRFSVSAQLVLDSSSNKFTSENVDEKQNVIPTKTQTSELQINLLSSTLDNTNNNNTNDEENTSTPAVKIEYIAEYQEQTDKDTVLLHAKHLEDSLEFSKTNDNDFVTKDKSADEFTTKTITEDIQQIIDRKDSDLTNIKLMTKNDEIQMISDNEAIEECIFELRTKTEEENPKVSLQLDDSKTSKRLTAVDARLQQFEVITNNEKEKEISHKQLQENIVGIEIATNEEDTMSELIKDDTVTNGKTTATLVSNIEIEKKTDILKEASIEDNVPLTMETIDNEILEINLDDKKEHLEKNNSIEDIEDIQTSPKTNSKASIEEYPDDLNPFKSDEESEEVVEINKENVELRTSITYSKKDNLNPFDSSDDEVELEKIQKSGISIYSKSKVPPPRPPPPRISKNPFGSEDEDETSNQNFTRRSSLTGSQSRKTPVPTPRSNIFMQQKSLNL